MQILVLRLIIPALGKLVAVSSFRRVWATHYMVFCEQGNSVTWTRLSSNSATHLLFNYFHKWKKHVLLFLRLALYDASEFFIDIYANFKLLLYIVCLANIIYKSVMNFWLLALVKCCHTITMTNYLGYI
jgi:hypothetical protein